MKEPEYREGVKVRKEFEAGGPAFVFAGIANAVGAPSFAFFAKGGYDECLAGGPGF